MSFYYVTENIETTLHRSAFSKREKSTDFFFKNLHCTYVLKLVHLQFSTIVIPDILFSIWRINAYTFIFLFNVENKSLKHSLNKDTSR